MYDNAGLSYMDHFLHVEDRQDLGIHLYWYFLINFPSFSIFGQKELHCTEEEGRGYK